MKNTDRYGITIDDHPYDRGYFAAFNGEPCPTDRQGREGWRQCKRDDKDPMFDRQRLRAEGRY